MDIRSQLLIYGQKWPDELKTVTSFVEFIDTHHDCFERSNLSGHITSSAWLVDPKGLRVLLTHHKKLNMWIQLGGHADGVNDLLSVAVREAKEESGIDAIDVVSRNIYDIDIHPIPARGSVPAHLHFDVRYVLRALTMDYVVSDESHELDWVDIQSLELYTTEPSMLRMAKKWLAGEQSAR